MADTPNTIDAAQSLIRFLRIAATHAFPPAVTLDQQSIACLLDHIDTLTAKLAERVQ